MNSPLCTTAVCLFADVYQREDDSSCAWDREVQAKGLTVPVCILWCQQLTHVLRCPQV